MEIKTFTPEFLISNKFENSFIRTSDISYVNYTSFDFIEKYVIEFVLKNGDKLAWFYSDEESKIKDWQYIYESLNIKTSKK